MKFTEAKLEETFVALLANEGYPHHLGNTLNRAEDEVLLEDDLRAFLERSYAKEHITPTEIEGIILQLKTLPASDLYESNKRFMRMKNNGRMDTSPTSKLKKPPNKWTWERFRVLDLDQGSWSRI